MPPRITSRTPRRDALRNRSIVLEAARRVFSARGQSARLEEVATAAGLGVGTVHRAFGSKASLVDALLEAELDGVLAAIQEWEAEPTGWAALRAALWGLTDVQLRNRALHDMLFASGDTAAARARGRIEPRLALIVERAKQEGALRADFTASDLAILSRSVSSIRAVSPQRGQRRARRHVELLLKGIAATPDEYPVPTPEDDDFPTSM